MRGIVYAALLSAIGICGWFAQTAPSLAACGDNGKCGPVYGLATIAKDQTPQLLIYGTGGLCAAKVALVDQTGKTLASVTRTVGPGQTVLLDQGAFFDGGLPLAPGATHLSMRPVISFIPPNPCQGLVTTFAVADAATGRVGVIYPPDPIARPEPIFGFDRTTTDDIARINITNAGKAACMVTAGFEDNTGNVLQSQKATIESGKSLVVEQKGGATMRPVVMKQRACPGLIQKVEMVDAAMDKTRFFWPPDPIIRVTQTPPMTPAP